MRGEVYILTKENLIETIEKAENNVSFDELLRMLDESEIYGKTIFVWILEGSARTGYRMICRFKEVPDHLLTSAIQNYILTEEKAWERNDC